MLQWKSIPIPPNELSLTRVLRCGQTFRWKNIDDVWSFALDDRIIFVKQDDHKISYSHVLKDLKKESKDDDSTRKFIDDYFSLDTSLVELYDFWLTKHAPHAKSEITPFHLFPGIRLLRQHPWETSISFICSSNNNVKRISKMCDNLCNEFGDFVNEYDGIKYYSFPTAEQLSVDGTEAKLRVLGFGYRARYIYETALKFTTDEYPDITIDKLVGLRNESYPVAHEFLLQLNGVGPKVADCICLMSLDKHDTIPVDTHIYQIAVRDYKYKGKKDMKMNKQVYNEIRAFFQDLFGEYAGWAQSVLFASDLSDLNNGVNLVKNENIKTENIKTEKTKGIKRELEREIGEINKDIESLEKDVGTVILKKEVDTVEATPKIKIEPIDLEIKKEPFDLEPKRIRVR